LNSPEQNIITKLSFMANTPSWKSIIGKLSSSKNLERSEATWALEQIMAGESEDGVVAAFLVALRHKGESVQEISGLVDAMLTNCLKLELPNDALDIVGTGGDLFGTVNVSSMASIVAAATGVPLLKHGSRSASGKTGSSEMLEALGIRLDLNSTQVAEVFRAAGITFFFAPVFHPALAKLAAVRKMLAVPTTFNFLGPLANPVQPLATALGVSNAQMAPLMATEMAARGRSALVFRGRDGLDELSTVEINDIWQVSGGEVRESTLNASNLGLKPAKIDYLIGGEAKENAQVAIDVFQGKTNGNLGWIKDIVLLNAAGGVVSYNLAKDSKLAESDLEARFAEALQLVTGALESGAAERKLDQWITASKAS
jgi:anthranilate phosphoribosyltransferase